MQRIETLVQQVEQFSDPGARDTTREIVQSLLELHGAGLATMLTLAAEAKEAGPPLVDAFVADGLVASLFLLHGLHPLDIETRIRAALVRIRPHLHAHNGEVELLGLSEGIVRLRLQG